MKRHESAGGPGRVQRTWALTGRAGVERYRAWHVMPSRPGPGLKSGRGQAEREGPGRAGGAGPSGPRGKREERPKDARGANEVRVMARARVRQA